MLRDGSIPLDARGALSFILSYPPHWQFNEKWLCDETGIGRDRARRIIRDLDAAGYCQRQQTRRADGTMGPAEYLFSDEPVKRQVAPPQTENPSTVTVDGKTDAGSPVPGEPTTANPTEKNIYREPNTELNTGKGEQARPPAPPPTSAHRKPAKKAVARRTRLPDDVVLSDERLAHAVGKGMSQEQAHDQWQTFCDHHRAKGSAMADWAAAWRNWVRKAFEYGHVGNGRRAPASNKIGGYFDAGREVIEELYS